MDIQNARIDREHLSRQTMGDVELQREVLQLFADQLVVKIDALTPDTADIAQQAHSIKGSARGVGAWAVATAAEALEAAIGSKEHQLLELRQIVSETLKDVQSILNGG